MNRSRARWLATSFPLIALGGWSCGSSSESDDPVPPEAPFVTAELEATLSEVRDCRFSIEHDGSSIRVLTTPDVADAYTKGIYPFMTGATIVKKEHSDGACMSVTGYAAMRKEADGSWSWQRLSANFVVDKNTDPKRCATCHAACTEGRDQTCTNP